MIENWAMVEATRYIAVLSDLIGRTTDRLKRAQKIAKAVEEEDEGKILEAFDKFSKPPKVHLRRIYFNATEVREVIRGYQDYFRKIEMEFPAPSDRVQEFLGSDDEDGNGPWQAIPDER